MNTKQENQQDKKASFNLCSKQRIYAIEFFMNCTKLAYLAWEASPVDNKKN